MVRTPAGVGSASDNLVGLDNLAGVAGILGKEVCHGRARAGSVQLFHWCAEHLDSLVVQREN